MKQFSFRFDVDTHRCAERGLPALLELAFEYKVPFTFFVNPGRSVNRLDFARQWAQEKTREPNTQSLSALRKLGLRDYARVSLLNPRITNYASSLRQIDLNQHEVGLHGGSNHQNWARHASEWSRKTLSDEVDWGKKELMEVYPNLRIDGFASPGFTSPKILDEILYERGFKYSADLNTSNARDTNPMDSGNLRYPLTSLFGSTAGIATVEHFTAIGMSRKDIVAKIVKQIVLVDDSLVIYDHPYFAGIEALNVFRDLLDQIMSLGIEIVTMRDQALAK